jgi:hypothetical protein
MPAIKMFAGRFDRLRTGTPRSYAFYIVLLCYAA